MSFKWVSATLIASLLFLWNGSFERAAQLVLLGTCLEVSSGHDALQAMMLAPFLSFAVFGIIVEIVHFIHKRRYSSHIRTWQHIEKIRAQCDFQTLIQLMLERNSMVSLKEWQEGIHSKPCAVDQNK
jgi:hypothetical protein